MFTSTAFTFTSATKRYKCIYKYSIYIVTRAVVQVPVTCSTLERELFSFIKLLRKIFYSVLLINNTINESREVNSFILHLRSVDAESHKQGCIITFV